MRKSILRRWWFWVIVIVVIIGLASQGANQGNDLTAGDNKNEITTTPTEGKKEDLELLESSIKKDEFYSYVIGKIKNNTNKEFSYVQVEINLYDESGAQVGSTLDNINNLEAGATWNFEAPILEGNAKSYKIKDITKF